MVEVYKLAYELEVSSVEIITAMKKLGIPVHLPNPSVSTDDAQKIRTSFKKRSGFLFKNVSLFITAIVSITLLLSINSDKVFADDAAPPTPIATASEPTSSSLLSLKENVVVASETIKDSFTILVQEKLIDLGMLSGPATGINDKVTQEAIKSFQEKAGLEKIDGMVGPETLPKLLQGEEAYTDSSAYLQTADFSDTQGPKWSDDEIVFSRVSKTQLDILWGHVTDNVGITTFNFYVDGVLHLAISGNDCKTKCSSQTSGIRAILTNLTKGKNHDFKIEACDAAGNCSVKLPKIRDDKNKVPFASEIGTNFNLNIPSVNKDDEIVRYEVYVNGVLSIHKTVTDSKLFVYPKFDMTCGDQFIELIAFDKDDNEIKKYPSITISQTDPCISVIATTTTTTTTLPGTPSITITASEVSDGDTSSDSSLSLTFTTSASTTDFAAGDVSVSGGTLSNFAGSGTTYTATFTPTAQGATTIDVASSTFTNASTGVDNTAATQFNWTYSTAPTMTITAAEVNDGDSSADTSLSVTFTASQSTTNFAAGDVVVSGGTLSNFSGSGTTYTATFTPSAEGATTIDVAGGTFTNAFSTNNTAATQFNWTYSTSSDSTTSANRWVIAVIDETGGAFNCAGSSNKPAFPGPVHNGICDVDGAWGEFRILWPNRKFFLIEPHRLGGSQSLTGLDQSIASTSNILMPTAFVTEAQAGVKAVYIQSTRNSGSVTNWWSRIGGSSLPSGAEVILWVDNSGSLTTAKVQAEYNAFVAAAASANVTITEVTNLTSGQGGGLYKEDWINPFDPDYP
ncbi:Ig-like domain-containing protein [Acidimicrobiia bacterium]|nr:Ig-like domain-containing protein [Acidimicrobiia bacterium]